MKTETHKALIRWADSVRGLPFEWGVRDCFTLAADALRLQGAGEAEYSAGSEAEAHEAALQIEGSERLRAAGAVDIEPAMARDGDVLIVPAEGWAETFYVVFGRYALTSAPEHGVGYVRTADVQSRAVAAVGVR